MLVNQQSPELAVFRLNARIAFKSKKKKKEREKRARYYSDHVIIHSSIYVYLVVLLLSYTIIIKQYNVIVFM